METNALILLLAEFLGVVAVVMLASISPRFQRRPLVFQYPRREGVIVLSLIGLILLLAFLFFRTEQTLELLDGEIVLDALIQRLVLAALAVIAFGAALLIRGQPLRSAGWNRAVWGVNVRLALALVFLTIFLRGEVFNLLAGVTRTEGLALGLWLLIALAEESVFRGYIQARLSGWLGDNNGWIITALLFTIYQAPFLLANPDTFLIRLGIFAIQALILGWMMRKCGHVIAPAIYRAVSEWVALL